MDFTLKQYNKLLSSIGPGDFRLISKGNIMRHDVDRSLKNALLMAQMEAKKKIRTTYFFRVPYTFDERRINKIYNLGHEVGFHYEVLDKAKGDFEKAIKIFKKEWPLFSRWNAKSICMHGNPLSKWDNRDLWKKYDFKEFGVEKEAYLSINFDERYYFTDTGRCWNNKDVSVKDTTNSKLIKIRNTNHLISKIKRLDNFYILTHPCRWNDSLILWGKELVWQNIKNVGKRLLK
jgi:hypothetical protein